MWPIIKHYKQDYLARIALPLGGIGTGTVSLGGRGDLRHWEIMNRPAKGFMPAANHGGATLYPFFALHARQGEQDAVTRALEGPIELADYEGGFGSNAMNHGLPRFRSCSFDAAYPFAQVHFSDADVPLQVRLEAFNPLIPGDADRSSIPVAVLRYVLTNPSATAVTATVCGNVPNFIGIDGSHSEATWNGQRLTVGAKGNQNTFRTGDGVQGIFMQAGELDAAAEAWGTMALTTMAEQGVSYRTRWTSDGWNGSLLDFWDDFSADGMLDERDGAADAPMASLAVQVEVPAGESRAVTFLLTWHFPNRMTWTPKPADTECACAGGCTPDNRIGNYYTTQYADAWDVAERVTAQLPALEADTLQFVQAFAAADLPPVVQDAALSNISTLRSQTCFRTPDGYLYGWEGCCDGAGCCLGSCTHVWNYEQALAFLFGELSVSMREVEFAHATDEDGVMSFRVFLPLDRANEQGKAAADGQMGCLMKLYRDWQLSGNDAMLRALWPKAKKALALCWVPGGWDADRDGVMEGCQHNTMDVEYYGPNPQMESWYLGALRAMEEMANYLGEPDFAATCRDLFTRGSAWTDAHLFNGDYYEHEIRPPQGPVPDAFRVGMGATALSEPELQLGAGCLVDQLVGQYMAHICGLGYLLQPDHVRATLLSIMRHNFKDGLHGHFNNMRSFALGDESALLMASYPRGRRPLRPFPYYTEAMTGFEYTAAVGMLYEGQSENGLRVIDAVRARYDGCKRNPFDEAECGHHYARAMASWGAVLALTGFRYSAVDGVMRFTAQAGQAFWSTGYAWGTCTQTATADGMRVELTVLYGALSLSSIVLDDDSVVAINRELVAGDAVSALAVRP
ncbi:MAG TPA: GH116 family glycosyl-hydrolase [Armatimonadota bacterium]|jgi:uncharacterized protein (DUF608 family)